jgi:hypothetical protein
MKLEWFESSADGVLNLRGALRVDGKIAVLSDDQLRLAMVQWWDAFIERILPLNRADEWDCIQCYFPRNGGHIQLRVIRTDSPRSIHKGTCTLFFHNLIEDWSRCAALSNQPSKEAYHGAIGLMVQRYASLIIQAAEQSSGHEQTDPLRGQLIRIMAGPHSPDIQFGSPRTKTMRAPVPEKALVSPEREATIRELSEPSVDDLDDDGYYSYVRRGIKDFSAIELHILACFWNWDCGWEGLKAIVESPVCDPATALLIFWAGRPADYFDDWMTAADPEEMDVEHRDLLLDIQERYVRGDFGVSRIAFDPPTESAPFKHKGILLPMLEKAVGIDQSGEIARISRRA